MVRTMKTLTYFIAILGILFLISYGCTREPPDRFASYEAMSFYDQPYVEYRLDTTSSQGILLIYGSEEKPYSFVDLTKNLSEREGEVWYVAPLQQPKEICCSQYH